MAGTAPKITADQATQSKANALAFQAQNLANRNATPAPVQKVTADQATQSKANALAFQAQNLAQRNPANVPTNVGSNITAGNTRTPPPTVLPNATQPTQGAMLSADIQSGQEATNRAREAEMAVSRTQGLDTTTQAKQIADYIAGKTATSTPQGTTTPTTGTSPTGTPLDAQVQQYKTNYDQVTADLTNAYNNFQGQTALQDQAYSGTVDPAKQELNDINQRLNEETLAGRRRVEAVLTIPGITKAQAQDKINEISRVNTSTQADLAIIQMAKQGQYDSAKEIADRKVSALIEEQKIKIDTLKFVYDNNKELFTKAEQRQFEVAQADRERKLNQEEKRLQEVNAVALSALEAGAPTRVVEKMFKAKTLAEATKLGGQYVGALDRQVKLANIAQSNASTARIYADIAKDRATEQAKKAGVVLTPVSAARIQGEVSSLNNLATSSGIKGAVGTSFATRRTTGFFGNLGRTLTLGNLQGVKGTVTGETSNFIAGVEQLREQSTLDKLVEAKASGATFGALSDGERQTLAAAASRLGTWAIKDKNGKVVAYDTSEKEMKKELDTINNFKKLDYIYRGGNIADVGVIQTPDGRFATQNSDGTYTILK